VKKSHTANAGAGVARVDPLVVRGLRVETLLLGERTLNSEPAFDILAAFGYREIPRLKQRRVVKLRRTPVNYRGRRIDLAELLDQMGHTGRSVRAVCEVCLGQNDPIRERSSGIQNAGQSSVVQS
jgi:hypothetical protein